MGEMMNSERKEFLDMITQERSRADASYAAALRYVNRIILEAEYLTFEQRDNIIKEVWAK